MGSKLMLAGMMLGLLCMTARADDGLKVKLQAQDGSAAYGHAILCYDATEDLTQVQVNCWGLKAGESYSVYLTVDGAGSYVGTFVVKKNGTGKVHAALQGDYTTKLPVTITDAASATVLLGQ